VISDPQGTIEWVNQAFTRLTGYSASEAIGESLWILKSGREEGALYEEPWKAVAAGQVWRGELVNRRKDGRLYTEEVTITPVRGTDGEISHLVAVQQDVTERKRMEEQLLQAQKMEAVGRLAGGVAHDFNNLLQAMLGVTELLRQPDLESEDAAPKLQELEELVQRGSQLTRQLLLFSRRDTARQEELDLDQVVQGTVKLLHRLLRENIDLIYEPNDCGLPLIADRGQIEQVVMNLAVNACDAMPTGGRLSLVTGIEAGSAWLKVSDTGEGIPEEIRDQLFEPFFTTKERGKGTGLGLSVVHGIVNRLGGRIDLDSQVGEGTTIRVTFPAIAVTGTPSRRTVIQEEFSGGDGEQVLVVEDDPAVRTSLEEILGVLGYQVTTVGCCDEVGRLPKESRFDLLLSDYVLPDGSGTDIAHQLRERWPDLGVIVMSGYAQDDVVGREAARGNLYFLQKPFNAQTLSEVVRTVLANGATVPDEARVE
jgi:PAS domain S-box-containing protein